MARADKERLCGCASFRGRTCSADRILMEFICGKHRQFVSCPLAQSCDPAEATSRCRTPLPLHLFGPLRSQALIPDCRVNPWQVTFRAMLSSFLITCGSDGDLAPQCLKWPGLRPLRPVAADSSAAPCASGKCGNYIAMH